MQTLLQLLVQYFGDQCLQDPLDWSLLNKLTVHLYELTQQMSAVATEMLQNQILNRQAEFPAEKQDRRARVVGLDTVRIDADDVLVYLLLIKSVVKIIQIQFRFFW